jgi:hypothetical protein
MYGPLIKYGAMAVAFVGFCLGLILYGEHRRQLEWDAAIATQAIASAQTVITAAENTARVETKFVRQAAKTKVVTQTIEKEVIRYVEGPSQKCVVSPEFERAFDTVSRVPDAPADGVPAAPSAPGVVAESPEAPVTDAAVLFAYQDAIDELDALWDTYHALVEWVRTSYAIQTAGGGNVKESHGD